MLKRISEKKLQLGEGPVWDAEQKLLYYVDIEGKEIGCYDPGSGRHVFWKTQEMPGCIVLDGQGNLISAEKDMLVRLNTRTDKREIIARFPVKEGLRFNDGKCDCRGRLWVGTMAIDQSASYAAGCGALYRYEGGEPVKVLEGLSIPNGIAFSGDNSTMYHIDTPTRQICSYRFDAETGTLSDRQAVVQVKRKGSPDGMTIDCEGMLWVALWDGYGVVRYDPKTGEELEFVPVPDRYVSCCTFGGEKLNLLYITSAMDEKGKGGYVYEWETDVKGTAPCPFQEESF